jgi:flagellar hook-associated protein 2
MSETQQAKDADITVDGVQNIKRSSNTISDVISGVTLRLKGEGTSTVEIERSDEIFTTRMNAFVNAYNGLVTTLGSLQSYDKQTQATGSLFGDATTQRIQSQMKNLLNNTVPGISSSLSHLTDLGITTDESGKLVLDSAVFSEQLESNYEDVVKFFTKTDSGSEGFAVRMATALDKILDTTNGTLAVRTKGIQTSIDSIEKQVEKLNKTMTLSETRLRIQFSSLEVLLGQYQGTSNSLASNLDALANGWGTGN